MQVWNLLHAARWNTGDAKNRHLGSIAQSCRAISSHLRHLLTIGKNLLNSNTSCTCSHNMVNFDPLTAEICWRVWSTPANFIRFRVLASLLHRRRSTEVNKTAWCLAKIALRQVLRSPILAALLHGTRAAAVSQTLWRSTRNRILLRNFRQVPPIEAYSAGRPSRWASAHILVFICVRQVSSLC